VIRIPGSIVNMRLLHARTDQRAVGQGHSSKFDKSTGQVYTETTAAIQCSDDRNWTQNGYEQFSLMNELKLGSYVHNIRSCAKAKAGNEREIRSLKDIAMQCLVKNISDVTLELIRSIPSKLRLQVWEAVKESLLLSVSRLSCNISIVPNKTLTTF
jgi:hypothetical protein